MTRNSVSQKWLYTADNKTAGKIVGDVLRIVKTSKLHFVDKFQGYGIAAETLYAAERQGARFLHLIGYDGEEFRLRIREYIAAAIPATLNPKNGEQLFLSLKWLRWYTHRPAGHINETQPAALGPQYEQPSLFS